MLQRVAITAVAGASAYLLYEKYIKKEQPYNTHGLNRPIKTNAKDINDSIKSTENEHPLTQSIEKPAAIEHPEDSTPNYWEFEFATFGSIIEQNKELEHSFVLPRIGEPKK